MRPLTPNMKALLGFISKRHAETGQPVSAGDVALAGVVPARNRLISACGLLRRGLIAVPRIGTAAWVPTPAAQQFKEAP